MEWGGFEVRASAANKLDPNKCDYVRDYLEAETAGATEPCVWAVKGQLMRGGRVGTELVQKQLQRLLTGTRPLTPEAVDSFLSVVVKDTGKCFTIGSWPFSENFLQNIRTGQLEHPLYM